MFMNSRAPSPRTAGERRCWLPITLSIGTAWRAKRASSLSGLGLRANGSGRGLVRRTIDNLRFALNACWTQLRSTRKTQVIHFQFPLHLPFGLMPFLLAKLGGLKIVFTAHDPVPHKWLFRAPWNRIERWSLACAYSLSDRVIVHSAAGFNTVTKEFAIPPSKLAMIAHGPFSCRFRRRNRCHPTG